MFAKIAKEFDRLTARFRSVNAVRIRNPAFGDLDAFCAGYAATHRTGASTATLDLGCGAIPRNPFRADALNGIDLQEDPRINVKYADLATEAIPYGDASFDYVTAYDLIEHVPRVLYSPARRFPFVELMSEIHRVLKPGGVLVSHTPAYPYASAFQDPTHVNVITEETFPIYFAGPDFLARIYGFKGAFTVVRQGWAKPHLITLLRKEPAVAVPGASATDAPTGAGGGGGGGGGARPGEAHPDHGKDAR